MDKINSLPDEVLLYIFQYLSQTEIICNIRNVCVRWKRVSFSPSLWRCLKMVEIDTDTEQLIWSKNNIKEVKHFVRNIYICLVVFISGKEVFTKLKDCKLNRVEQLQLQESHRENTETFSILEYLAKENTNLSSLSLTFHTCNRLNDYFRIFSNLQLRKLELVHGGSLRRLRHKCKGCSEQIWTTCLSELCTGSGKNLRELTLGVGIVDNVAVKRILISCKYLESLILSRTATGSDCFDDLPQTTNLVRLGLHHVDITDVTLIDIAKFAPFLKLFELQGKLEMITDHGMTQFSEKCKYIEKIYFRNRHQHAPNLSDLTLFHIASNSKFLNCLSLEAMTNINDAGFQALVENCPNLVEIAMLSCCNLTDLSLIALGDNCRLVKKVEFSGSVTEYKHMTNNGVEQLITKLKYLEEGIFTEFTNLRNIKLARDTDLSQLNLVEGRGHTRNDNMQDSVEPASNENNDVSQIVKININHSHVRYLSFARCELLDDESVLQILKFCPDLRQINLFNCTNISEDLYKSVFKICNFIPEVKINGRIFWREPC